MLNTHLVILGCSWLLYFVLHSFLASIWMKSMVAKRWPTLMPAYRLLFNILAVILLLIPLGLTFSYPGGWIWQWLGLSAWISNGLALAAVAGFVISLKYYDGSEFLGFKQLYQQIESVDDQESFQLSPFHRYVRHPWYFFALVIIWTRDMNAAWLLSSIMATAYFFIGSRFEEIKLIRYHGNRYREYIDRVPGLVPLPWKYLNPSEAERLGAGTAD